MSKYEDCRIVSFKEAYTVPTAGGGTRTLYKKGSTHAIHKTIADKLEKAGAKVTVENLNHKAVIDKKKAEFDKRKQVRA